MTHSDKPDERPMLLRIEALTQARDNEHPTSVGYYKVNRMLADATRKWRQHYTLRVVK